MSREFKYTLERKITLEMNDVLTSTFLQNPMFGEYIFERDRRGLSSLMHLCLLYYSRYGIIYSLRDSDDKIVALSLWNEPGGVPLDIIKLMTHGFFFATAKCGLTIGYNKIQKLLNVIKVNEKHHIKEPHYYMFIIASIRKGCGRMLFNNCLDQFKGHTLFWESSVSKDNHAYYKSFGAEMIGEEIIHEYSNAFFIFNSSVKFQSPSSNKSFKLNNLPHQPIIYSFI